MTMLTQSSTHQVIGGQASAPAPLPAGSRTLKAYSRMLNLEGGAHGANP